MGNVLWILLAFLMVPTVVAAQHDHSSYTGQEKRAIKTLSAEEIQALSSGQGMGLARVAELNHYPGPRHVLDLSEPLQLSATQRATTQQLYDHMHQEAVRLGALIIDKERALEHLFATQAVDSETLRSLTKQVGQLQGDLRLVHLQAHIAMKGLLSDEQVRKYDDLRGYTTSASPAPPIGHQHRRHP